MTPDFFPADRFHCLLDDQPDYLVPGRLLQPREGHGPLVVNPMCWFAWQGPPHADLAERIGDVGGLFESPWTVWVDDPATRALMPFWLGPELAHMMQTWLPGQPLGERPRDDLLAILWSAGIVVTPDYAARRRQAWFQYAHACSVQAASRGYVSLEGLLHPFHVGALRRYFRHQTRTGRFQLGDDQTPARYIAHNEPLAGFFHRQLTHAISDAAGALVVPSYTYTALYLEGANLEMHTDREQCEYTVSLCFDATPEPQAQVPWPLQVQTAEGPLAFWQHLGDALLFRGRYLPHGRDRLAEGHTTSSILFHYVDRGFAGPVN